MTDEPQDPTSRYDETAPVEPAGDAPAAPEPTVEEPELPWSAEDAAAMEPPVVWEPDEADAWPSDPDGLAEPEPEPSDDVEPSALWDVDDDLPPEDVSDDPLDETALPVALPDEPLAPEADEADETGEPDANQEPLAPARSGRGLVTALAALVVALLVLTGVLGYLVADSRGEAPIEKSRSAALAAGRDAARLVFSYDYRHLDKDFAAASAVTTGTFKKDYANTTKKLVGDVAPRYKAVLLADVSEAAVVSASEKQVLLLVFLDVQSTSTLAATPKITPRRLKMTMQHVGDRWLVSNVDAF